MKVILKSDVYNLGRAGQTITVKPGYARNYLFPNNLALPNHSKGIKELRHKAKIAELKSKKAGLLRDELAKKIQGQSFEFEKEASDKGTLFGSVSAFEVISALKEKGFYIDKKTLNLEAPLKEAGEHKLILDFGNNSTAEILLVIKGKKPKKVEVEARSEDPEELEEEEEMVEPSTEEKS